MQHTFTLRPTPGEKDWYDILWQAQVVATVRSRAGAKMIMRQYQTGQKQVRFVDEPAAAVAGAK